MMELSEEQKREVEKALKSMWKDYEDSNSQTFIKINKLQEKVENLPEFVEQTNRKFEEFTSIKTRKMSFF